MLGDVPGFVAVTGDFNQSNCIDNKGYYSLATSTDGIKWNLHTDQFPSQVVWLSLVYQPVTREFIIIGDTDPDCGVGSYKSTDGITWTPVDGIPHDYNEIQAVAVGPDRVVGYGENRPFSLIPEGGGPSAATPYILLTTNSIWQPGSNGPILTQPNENVTQLFYDEQTSVYYGIGYHGVYESLDGNSWSHIVTNDINNVDIFANNFSIYNPIFGGGLYMYNHINVNIRNSIVKFGDIYVIHMSYGQGNFHPNYNYYMFGLDSTSSGNGKFYYSTTGINGPWINSNNVNFVDDMVLDLYTDGNLIIIGLGWSISGNICGAYSYDGINWNPI
jgi:hypothetical protein